MCDRSISDILKQKIKLHFEILRLLEIYKLNKSSNNLLINDGDIKITGTYDIDMSDTENMLTGGYLIEKCMNLKQNNMTLQEAAKNSFSRIKRVLAN